jgi:hypothetical protein
MCCASSLPRNALLNAWCELPIEGYTEGAPAGRIALPSHDKEHPIIDVDTFLTTLDVMVDDFCMLSLPSEPHSGPQVALSRSEVVTLALCG